MAGFDWSQYATQGALRPDTFTGMQPQFQSALANLFSSAPEEIRSQLRVKSGYRSPERQQQLWNEALQKYGSPDVARKWVAPPGRSQHNHGDAADLQYLSPEALQWAHQNAANYGLTFPLKNENWHVELAGARGGQSAGGVAPTMANMQNKSFDPVGEVMAAKPGGAPQSLAAAFGPGMPGPVPGPMAAPQQTIGNLALLFAQQQQAKEQQKADEQQAEQTKRAALFAPDSLAGLFGAA